jgi:hypothetical protein
MWSLQKFVEFITTMYSLHNPGGLGAGAIAPSGHTGATECEATAAVSGLADNAVGAETACLAMHMRAVDLGRVVAEATLREQSAATGPNAGIRAEVGVSRSSREKY